MAEAEHNPEQAAEPRDTDPLHELLQDHISKCDDCRKALDTGMPRGFGQKGKYCRKYFEIIQLWSQGEFTREQEAKLTS